MPRVRFAFYGRTSTAQLQDPVTSRAWQREMAATLVAGHGTITTEFFDIGVSRRVAWDRRSYSGPSGLIESCVVGAVVGVSA
ncbi:MAG: hypothetical protein ACLGIF_05085 [Actinomycetes bacterium]